MVVVAAEDVNGGDFVVGEAHAARPLPLLRNGLFFGFGVVRRFHCSNSFAIFAVLTVWCCAVQCKFLCGKMHFLSASCVLSKGLPSQPLDTWISSLPTSQLSHSLIFLTLFGLIAFSVPQLLRLCDLSLLVFNCAN